jgi:hypothetical protein
MGSHGEIPFHSNNAQFSWGIPFSMKRLGGTSKKQNQEL